MLSARVTIIDYDKVKSSCLVSNKVKSSCLELKPEENEMNKDTRIFFNNQYQLELSTKYCLARG